MPTKYEDAPRRHVSVNGPTITIMARENSGLFLREEAARFTDPSTGEVLQVTRSVTNPFHFQVTGEKLIAEIDLTPVFQEALLHIVKANPAPGSSDEEQERLGREAGDALADEG